MGGSQRPRADPWPWGRFLLISCGLLWLSWGSRGSRGGLPGVHFGSFGAFLGLIGVVLGACGCRTRCESARNDYAKRVRFPFNFEIELCRGGLPRWSVALVSRPVHMMDVVSCEGLFGALLGALLGPVGSILEASWKLL